MFLGVQDFIFTPLWFIFFLLLGKWVRNKWYAEFEEAKYFMPALALKMMAGIVLGLVYNYYYGYGDTLRYFFSGQVIRETILNDFDAGWRLLFSGPDELPPDLKETSMLIPYWKHQRSALLIGRISGLLSLITFHSYYANTLFFSVFSFTGVWALYRSCCVAWNNYSKKFAICILFFPSVVFWGSGLFKDPIALGLLGWFIWAFARLIEKRNISVKNSPISRLFYLFLTILAGLGIYHIKVYILLALIPFLMLWYALDIIHRIESKGRKIFVSILVFLSFSLAGLGIYIALTTKYQQFAVELVIESAISNREELLYTEGYYKQGYGSRFDLGEVDPSFWGVVQKMPVAIFAALFRPGIWDASSPIILISALENTLILLLTLIWLAPPGMRFNFSGFKKDPRLLSMFLFSLVFAFFVGLSTSNFGTLGRYRIPCLSLFLVSMVVLKDRKNQALAAKAKAQVVSVKSPD